jgi:uroporphyrinogen-III synthase
VPEATPVTVAITSTGPVSTELAALLVAQGAAVRVVATTTTVATDGIAALTAALAADAPVDWLVLTSAAAVPMVAAAISTAGLAARTKVAAVGPATAAALREAGIVVDLEGEGRGGAALGALLGTPTTPGATAVLARSARAIEEIDEVLIAAGFDVRPVVVYDTVARQLSADELAALAHADVVAAAAPSALDSLLDQEVRPHAVAAIGATTARRARAAGIAVVTEASAPTAAALAAAVAAAVDRSRTGA